MLCLLLGFFKFSNLRILQKNAKSGISVVAVFLALSVPARQLNGIIAVVLRVKKCLVR